MDPIITRHSLNTYEFDPAYKLPKSWRNWLIGRPLATADAPHQTIGKAVGLAVFAVVPISIAITILMDIVTIFSVGYRMRVED